MTTPFEEFIALPDVRQVGERDAVHERPPLTNNMRAYYRFLPDGRVLLTHRLEISDEAETLACASQILTVVEESVDSVWGRMKMLPGLSCGLAHLDHVLTVPPIVEYISFLKEQVRLVRNQLYCMPANRCEFAEGETKQEYLARMGNLFPNNRWNRTPVPAVSATWNITGKGQSRQRRPAVTRYTYLPDFVKSVGEKGGVVTVENFERERCIFESDTPGADLSVVFQRQTHVMPVDDALSFLDVLAREGAAAAETTLAGEA